MMREFVPNSNKSKEEQKRREAERKDKKIEPVVRTPVKSRKKSELKKLTDIFIAEDISNVKSYILSDVVIPAIKDAIEDIVHMLLRGTTSDRKKGTASRISYRDFYGKDNGRRDYSAPRSTSVYDIDEQIIETRGEAEAVLSRMDDIMATYGVVSVADFYDLLGVSCDYTANKYGWTNIRNAQVVRVREGYVIKLPRAMPITN